MVIRFTVTKVHFKMCLANKIMPLVTIQNDNVMQVHEIESEGLQKDLPSL